MCACETPRKPCPVCGGAKWEAQTTVRQGKTLAHGPFAARKSGHSCAHGCHHPNRSKITTHSLTVLLLPAGVVVYDGMVCVGVKRFHEHRQRDRIRTTLIGLRYPRAIDVILGHIETHPPNLWGHAILLEQNARMRVRLVSRTNHLIENRFKELKHGKRRRSGQRTPTQDLEHLPAEALLVSNLQRQDYVLSYYEKTSHRDNIKIYLTNQNLLNYFHFYLTIQ